MKGKTEGKEEGNQINGHRKERNKRKSWKIRNESKNNQKLLSNQLYRIKKKHVSVKKENKY